MIGAIGGVLVVLAVPLLDKLKIDDVVGAIPVHLVCGIWGTMAVPISNHGTFGSGDPTFLGQFVGVVAIGVFVCIASAIVWLALKFTVGIRVTQEEEMDGLDYAELGLEAYPEFTRT
jgi:Amt family ammonium transporter